MDVESAFFNDKHDPIFDNIFSKQRSSGPNIIQPQEQ